MNKPKMKELDRKILAGFAMVVSSLVLLALVPSPLAAQSFYGAVVGTVKDASGAVVPGASVTIANIGTNEKPPES